LRRSCDCIVGLREANHGSGVGLFNQLLAHRLGIPYLLLDQRSIAAHDHPLFSLKFEELDEQQALLLRGLLAGRRGRRPFSLFLHTLDLSELEAEAIRDAAHVFCGNDAILRRLAAAHPDRPLERAFAPTLIPEHYREHCRPARVELFYFGMASKIDRGRFRRLHELLHQAAVEYKLLCSLAVHQTSDGTCIPQALAFLRENFPEQLVYLGTLDDMGVAYFLNRPTVFIGFYRGGARSNNTTFNTALRFGKRIITNLDADSPAEVRFSERILNLDAADADNLRNFLDHDDPSSAQRLADLFAWDELVARLQSAWQTPLARVA